MHFFNQPLRLSATDSNSDDANSTDAGSADSNSVDSISADSPSVDSASVNSTNAESNSLIDKKTIAQVQAIVATAIGKKFLKANDGDEIEQEILIRMWEKQARFDPERASWSTFCALIARNTIAEHHRNRGGKRKLEFESLDTRDQYGTDGVVREFTESDKPSSRTCNRRNAEEFAELQSAIALAKSRLPKSLQQVCNAIQTSDSFESAAKQLGFTSATLRRRRQKLRELLADSPLSQEK